MSSFLFEKEQINCACFQSNSTNVRRIFRSQSQHSSVQGIKNNNNISIKNQLNKTKYKKKSLRRPLQNDELIYQKTNQQRQSHKEEICRIQNQVKNYRKQPQRNSYQHEEPGIIIGMRTQRSRCGSNIRSSIPSSIPRVSIVSQPFIIYPQNKGHHYTYSQQLIILPDKEQYEKRVQQQFKKDLDQFSSKMENNIGIKEKENNQKSSIQCNIKDRQNNIQLLKEKDQKQIKQNDQNQLKITYDQQVKSKQEKQVKSKQGIMSQKEIHQIQQLFLNKPTIKRRQSITSRRKMNLDKMQSLPDIPHNKPFSNKTSNQLKQIIAKRQRKQSFRNSTICFKQKQIQTKKLKDKMYAKQIQSQKDGDSSSQSSKMSQVVGRGWDGMTQQKLQLEELQQMIKQQNNHSQTMITQQSHINIKNSQIKTMTDYSNSFISPKSQNSKPMITSQTAFGGAKYGITGISYQNIDDLRKVKNSFYQQVQP